MTFSLLRLLGAVCLFLWGLHLAELGFRQAAGDRLRSQVNRCTANMLFAYLFGIAVTITFQSSIAAISLLIGLTSIGVLNFRRAAPVVLGADLGTTVLIVLLASVVKLNMGDFAMSVLILGFIATFIFRSDRAKFLAEGFLGFGFIFFGLSLIQAEGIPLRQSQLTRDLMTAAAHVPLAGLLCAALFAVLIHSGMAVIGVVLSFVAAGLMTFEAAIPFVLGANLGSSIVPLTVGLRSRTEGKRLSVFHVSTKVLGVLLVFPFIRPIAEGVPQVFSTLSYQVAALHVGFNLFLSGIFLPLLGSVTGWMGRLIPARGDTPTFGAQYLDAHALETPPLALANVFREILRMAEITQKMVAQALTPLEAVGPDASERLEELDDQVDALDREIKFYLARMNHAQLTDAQARRQLELLMITHDLESIGDVITKDILRIASKKRKKQVRFSQEGWQEIKQFHQKVMENFSLAVTSFATGEAELGRRVLRQKRDLAHDEEELGQAHLLRLHQGLQESFDTSSIHLDILSNLRRINSIVAKLTYPVLDRRKDANLA